MQYVLHVLAVILIGTAIGAAMSQRNSVALTTCLIGIVLAAVTFFVSSWIPLAVGLVVFLVGQGMQHGSSRA